MQHDDASMWLLYGPITHIVLCGALTDFTVIDSCLAVSATCKTHAVRRQMPMNTRRRTHPITHKQQHAPQRQSDPPTHPCCLL